MCGNDELPHTNMVYEVAWGSRVDQGWEKRDDCIIWACSMMDWWENNWERLSQGWCKEVLTAWGNEVAFLRCLGHIATRWSMILQLKKKKKKHLLLYLFLTFDEAHEVQCQVYCWLVFWELDIFIVMVMANGQIYWGIEGDYHYDRLVSLKSMALLLFPCLMDNSCSQFSFSLVKLFKWGKRVSTLLPHNGSQPKCFDG